jgi:S-adenosylmethionine synthetase
MNNNIKTAEYCRRGHPDRVCDIIADSILDECLKQDPNSRVAVEVFGSHGFLTIGGEITTKAKVPYAKIAIDTYRELGYTSKFKRITTYVDEQSSEISDLADEGAGDSGIVTGYACNETPEMLPLEVALAKRIADKLDEEDSLLPDGKVQVTTNNDKVESVVVSYQAEKNQDELIESIVLEVLEKTDVDIKLIHFVKGGFEADTGLTGRKNVLWYGPRIPIGGGAFAGKDPTKVDRSGAYLARNIALNHLQATEDKEALIEIAYIIGKKEPLYIKVNGEARDATELFSVSKVIDRFNLRKTIYKNASILGHFGNKIFTWE